MTEGGGDRPRGERNREPPGGLKESAEATVRAPDEDVQLMLALRAGDASAFDALFRRWSGPLLRYLERMVRDTAVAEELVQEAFIRVHQARDRYRPEARFSTWLYRIATNLALNELRRPRQRAVHRSADEDGASPLVDDRPGTEDVVDARRRAVAVWDALAELPEKQRAALCLAAVEGLPYAEVAEALEVTEKAVKSLVHRARSGLAERLEREEV